MVCSCVAAVYLVMMYVSYLQQTSTMRNNKKQTLYKIHTSSYEKVLSLNPRNKLQIFGNSRVHVGINTVIIVEPLRGIFVEERNFILCSYQTLPEISANVMPHAQGADWRHKFRSLR